MEGGRTFWDIGPTEAELGYRGSALRRLLGLDLSLRPGYDLNRLLQDLLLPCVILCDGRSKGTWLRTLDGSL